LPGSRRSEVVRHLPILMAAVALLRQRLPDLRVVLPTLPWIGDVVRDLVRGADPPVVVIDERSQRFDAYAASTLAIAASGTISLEIALAGLPCITIYRVGPASAWLARRLIRVPHVNMVNLILGRPAIPELLQEACEPERIAATAGRLIEDEGARRAQRAALAEAAGMLGADSAVPPSEGAAKAVLRILRDRPS